MLLNRARRITLAQMRYGQNDFSSCPLRLIAVLFDATARAWCGFMESAFSFTLAAPAGSVVADVLGKFLPVRRIKTVINRHGLGSFPLRQQRGIGIELKAQILRIVSPVT